MLATATCLVTPIVGEGSTLSRGEPRRPRRRCSADVYHAKASVTGVMLGVVPFRALLQGFVMAKILAPRASRLGHPHFHLFGGV